MTTEEGNKLIAEFMGGTGKLIMNRIAIFWPSYDYPGRPTYDGAGIVNYKYHSSWDWLMPVIGKISHECEEPEELDNLKYSILCNNIDSAWIFVTDYISK